MISKRRNRSTRQRATVSIAWSWPTAIYWDPLELMDQWADVGVAPSQALLARSFPADAFILRMSDKEPAS